jgi:hypothetical protein
MDYEAIDAIVRAILDLPSDISELERHRIAIALRSELDSDDCDEAIREAKDLFLHREAERGNEHAVMVLSMLELLEPAN